MDDSEAMIDRLRFMSTVTLAQVAAATEKVINNPGLGEAMSKSIRQLGTGGTLLKGLLVEIHITLRRISKNHTTLQAFAERWGTFRKVRYPLRIDTLQAQTRSMQAFDLHLIRARESAANMQRFLNGKKPTVSRISSVLPAHLSPDFILVLVPTLEGDDPGDLEAKKKRCTDFLKVRGVTSFRVRC
jgi:hypothetical protein